MGVDVGVKVFVGCWVWVGVEVGVSVGIAVFVLVGVIVGVFVGVKVGKRVGMIGTGVLVTFGVIVNVALEGILEVGVGWFFSLIDTKVYPKA